MRYTGTKDARESDNKVSFNSSTRQGNVMKRLLVLMVMTICLMLAGAQATPTAKAGGGCELICGDPFIDPNDGQCYVICCPEDKECMRACELRPCLK